MGWLNDCIRMALGRFDSCAMKKPSAVSRRYAAALRRLLEQANAAGVTNDQFSALFDESLKLTPQTRVSRFRRVLIALVTLSVAFFAVDAYLDNRPTNVMLCSVQEYIYPCMRLLRKMSLPIIAAFPSLTELYDETCLVQNPFFRVKDMDCWPCYSVKHVSEITDADLPFEAATSPPLIYKTHQQYIHYVDLKNVYLNNKPLFDENAPKIIVNNKDTILVADFFKDYNGTGSKTYRWRLNRMMPALTVRTLFPRPGIVPRLGQSTERFIVVDDPGSMSYSLPEPECNYVFVIQSSGERLLELQPAKECTKECESVAVLLRPPYMLWYNWWYWRPISHTTKSNSTSISYIGSYC